MQSPVALNETVDPVREQLPLVIDNEGVNPLSETAVTEYVPPATGVVGTVDVNDRTCAALETVMFIVAREPTAVALKLVDKARLADREQVPAPVTDNVAPVIVQPVSPALVTVYETAPSPEPPVASNESSWPNTIEFAFVKVSAVV